MSSTIRTILGTGERTKPPETSLTQKRPRTPHSQSSPPKASGGGEGHRKTGDQLLGNRPYTDAIIPVDPGKMALFYR